MKTQKNNNNGRNARKENYLAIPNSILNMPRSMLNTQEKALLAHIYSYGVKGCYQSNATLAQMFMRTERTVSRWVVRLQHADLIQIKSPKGFYRTMWAKSHPEVKAAAVLWYRGREIPKADGQAEHPAPSPGPAQGKPPALLDDRREGEQAEITKFKHKFGIDKTPFKPLTTEEFNNRRQQALAGLAAVGCEGEGG